MINITLVNASVATASADALVNPTNSFGEMRLEELSGTETFAIGNALGKEIVDTIQAQAPLAVGEAIVTEPGELSVKHVIHVAVTEQPIEPVPFKQAELACMAALRKADELGCKTLAMPALGVETGDIDMQEVARVMMETIGMYMVDNQLEAVALYSTNADMLQAWSDHKI